MRIWSWDREGKEEGSASDTLVTIWTVKSPKTGAPSVYLILKSSLQFPKTSLNYGPNIWMCIIKNISP